MTTAKDNTNLPATKTWKDTLDTIAPSIQDALPEHVTIDRFKRILASAIGGNPDIMLCIKENPQSVWSSAIACAKDGLIPDGREAALVKFATKVKCSDGITRKLATAQYMPMVAGVIKLMRQSGEVSSISAHVVYENDEFDYSLGDDERIIHKPILGGKRGRMIATYAILKTKDGGIYREIMGREQVEAVKNMSRSGDGSPWAGPFESEMWKKTVIRRLSKRAPLSTDVIDLIQRDDGLYDIDGSTSSAPANPRQRMDLSSGEILGSAEDAVFEDVDTTDIEPVEETKPSEENPAAEPEKTAEKEPAAEQGTVSEPKLPPKPPSTPIETLKGAAAYADSWIAYYNALPRELEEPFIDDTELAIEKVAKIDPDQDKRIHDAVNDK